MTTEVEMIMNITAKVKCDKDSDKIAISTKTQCGLSKEDGDKLVALVGAKDSCGIAASTHISMICAAIHHLARKTKQSPVAVISAVVNEISGDDAHA